MVNEINEIIDLLNQQFVGVKFVSSFDSQLKKFEITCNNLNTYKDDEFKEVLNIIRNHYNKLKFFVVYSSKT